MKKEAGKTPAKKPYEKPQVKRVKLEIIEATLGTGCYGAPGLGASLGNCPSEPLSCAYP